MPSTQSHEQHRFPSGATIRIGWIGLLALTYAVLGEIAEQWLTVRNGSTAQVYEWQWGVALGALIIGGRGLWPGVFLGQFVLSSLDHSTLAGALGAASGAALAATAAAVVFAGLGADRRLRSPSDMRRLLLVLIVIAAPIAATALTLSAAMFDGAGAHALMARWVCSETSHVVGGLVSIVVLTASPAAARSIMLRWPAAIVVGYPLATALLLVTDEFSGAYALGLISTALIVVCALAASPPQLAATITVMSLCVFTLTDAAGSGSNAFATAAGLPLAGVFGVAHFWRPQR